MIDSNVIVEDWLKVLRDPASKQAFGVLGTEDGARCCLGHLCDVCVTHGVIPPPDIKERNFDDVRSKLVYLDNCSGSLPEPVMKAAGITGALGNYDGGSLSDLNDLAKKSLPEIADIIESRPKGLFIEKESETT